jgi:hypothetical protein
MSSFVRAAKMFTLSSSSSSSSSLALRSAKGAAAATSFVVGGVGVVVGVGGGGIIVLDDDRTTSSADHRAEDERRRGSAAVAASIRTSPSSSLAALAPFPSSAPLATSPSSSSSSSSSSPPIAAIALRDLLPLDSVEDLVSPIVPAMEATVRGCRLLRTAMVIAFDYRFHRFSMDARRYASGLWSRVVPSLPLAPAKLFFDDDDEEDDRRERIRSLEGRIMSLECDLDDAQRRYAMTSDERRRARRNAGDDVDGGGDALPPPANKRAEKETMMIIANDLASANEELSSLIAVDDNIDGDTMDRMGGGREGGIHARNARRLLELCRTNGGVYVKVGQHLANLDLLLPREYVRELSSLFDDAPSSTYEDVRRVIYDDLGTYPEDAFDDFSTMPIASASLAQVHTAKCKRTGRRLAVKVQHRGLRETSVGDLQAMTFVVGVAEWLFEDFTFGWICEELTPQVGMFMRWYLRGG